VPRKLSQEWIMESSLRYEQGSCSDVGCVRLVNEDSHLAREHDGLWLVADGMGGHSNGSWASSEIAASLHNAWLPSDLEGALVATEAALASANDSIYRAGRREDKVIGSTVAALLIRARRFVVLWAGDSRVYRMRNEALSLVTTDHSQVEQLVIAGLLSREEAEDHPMAHMLSRAVGVRPELTLDLRHGDVLPSDVFVLCSDGLTRTVHDTEIEALVRQSAPRAAAARLVELALERGAADNVTVIVVGCNEPTLVAR
jgi:serine/threonine protein phosphatase PrpC